MNTSTNCRPRHLPPRQSNPHPPSLPPSDCSHSHVILSSFPTFPTPAASGYVSTSLTSFYTHSRPLEVPHLAEALSLLPARKATPPHLAQLSLWHLGKDVSPPASRRGSVANFGSLLMPSINFGQMLGSHGLPSLARPRTSRRTYGLFPSLKEEVVSSSRHSLSSYVRPSPRRRNPGHSMLMCQDVASSMQSYVLCITVTVSTLPSRHSGSPYGRDVLRTHPYCM